MWIRPKKTEELTEKDWIKRSLEFAIFLPLIVILIMSPNEVKEMSFTPLGYALRVMLWISTVHYEFKNFPRITTNLQSTETGTNQSW
jgi:hypothetical protein